ncbi:IclR family transcriptional regulator [Aeromicrobium sp. CF4.19]|uniref:IclR family transcriptional regulator n=1 Tax=Aeromicrobium sp. CF4.19 TaxID=3373082 RepID=UPI003EE5C8B3
MALETQTDHETPAMRMFSLLELIAAKDGFVSLAGLVSETGVPKPTMHRMIQQLESAGLLIRQSDGRHFGTGARLRDLAEAILLNATQHGARHAVLRALAAELGETCNVTALSGNEVIYLDRVESSEPLRFHLRPGAKVPVHASASGKMILSQLTPAQRRNLLGHTALEQLTLHTLTDLTDFEAEISRTREVGHAVDDEEYQTGLVCVAVLVPRQSRPSNLAVAVQAPKMRLEVEDAERVLPALRRAAAAIADIESEGAPR